MSKAQRTINDCEAKIRELTNDYGRNPPEEIESELENLERLIVEAESYLDDHREARGSQ